MVIWKPNPDSQVMVMVAHDATPHPWPGVISPYLIISILSWDIHGETLAVLRLKKSYNGQDPLARVSTLAGFFVQ